MNLSGNTILITGGTSGIGLELAKAFRAKGNDVVVSGRREHLLKKIETKHSGIVGQRLDLADPSDIQRFAKDLIAERPEFNVVVHNAGIMHDEALLVSDTSAVAEQTITTNVLGTMRLNAALLGHLQSLPNAVTIAAKSGKDRKQPHRFRVAFRCTWLRSDASRGAQDPNAISRFLTVMPSAF